MLRHFLNATARTSSRSLFAKPNPHFSGGLNSFNSTARTSSRSLFAKPNPPLSGGLNFFSSIARMSSRSLLAKPNAPVYVSSLRSLSGQKLCASEKYSESEPRKQSGSGGIIFQTLFFSFCFFHFIFVCKPGLEHGSSGSSGNKTLQLTSIVPLATKEPDLREWTRANMEYKMIDRRGSGMPPSTYFWSKAIVLPVTMPKLKEILDDLKSDGVRVEESENYFFLEANSEWKKKRFAELMLWLEDPGHKYFRAETPEENGDADKPYSLPKTRRALALSRGSSRKTMQLTSIVPLATREPDLREWTRANMEYKMIDPKGAEMPPSTYFWSKAIVAPVTMPKLKEILDDLKSDGARVEESDNYFFLEANSEWKKKRFAELMFWLEDPGHKYFRAVEEHNKKLEENRSTFDPAECAWRSEKKPSSLPKPRMDQSCYMGA